MILEVRATFTLLEGKQREPRLYQPFTLPLSVNIRTSGRGKNVLKNLRYYHVGGSAGDSDLLKLRCGQEHGV